MQVFYRPEQSVTVQSASPSAGKPAQVVTDWRERFGTCLEFVSFEPVTREDVYRALTWTACSRRARARLRHLTARRGGGAALYTTGFMRAVALAAWREGGITVPPNLLFCRSMNPGRLPC
jgi:hypothetical protein